LYEFEEDLDKDAVLGCFQRIIIPISRGPAEWQEAKKADYL